MPLFLVVSKLGLLSDYWGVILPRAAEAFGIFMVRQFMVSIPDELLEAARIDGASELKIFFKIVVPLSKPIIAVLVMLSTILTASVLFPGITSGQIIAIFAVGGILAVIAGGYLVWAGRHHKGTAPVLAKPELDRATWRMPPIALMSKPVMSAGSRTGLTVLRGYLLVASALVVVKVVQLAMGS